jgi:hypothetical protein
MLVVICFVNSELTERAEAEPDSADEVYRQTVAMQMIQEKQTIIAEMSRYGIQSLLARPEQITIKTLNRYLSLKEKGLA